MGQFITFISNHWELSLAFLIILFLLFLNEFVAKKTRAKELSPQEAIEKMNHEAATVFDLRDKDTFLAGHIIEAIQTTAEEFNQKRMEKYKSKPFILVCTRGIQAQALAAKLRQQGFTEAMVLAGGMTEWQSAGLPVVKGKNPPPPKKISNSKSTKD